MNTPRTFRLTEKAQKNLVFLSENFDMNEAKILNILLTEYERPLFLAAERTIQKYLIAKIENTANPSPVTSTPPTAPAASTP
jgi:hypothetical protein